MKHTLLVMLTRNRWLPKNDLDELHNFVPQICQTYGWSTNIEPIWRAAGGYGLETVRAATTNTTKENLI